MPYREGQDYQGAEVREKMTAQEAAKYMERAIQLAEKKRLMIARREAEQEPTKTL